MKNPLDNPGRYPVYHEPQISERTSLLQAEDPRRVLLVAQINREAL